MKRLSKRWNRSLNLSSLPWLVTLAMQCLTPASPLAAAPPAESARQEAERLRAARRAQARPIDAFVPYYSIEDGMDCRLFLMNTITDPIAVTVTARSAGGAELPLGSEVIESLNHVEIPLRQRLAGFEESFSTGSLRLSLVGDPDTLQGWAVLSGRGGEVFEIPITTPGKVTARAFYSFWDSTTPSHPDAGGVILRLLNVSRDPLRMEIATGDGRRTETASLELAPGAVRVVAEVAGRPFSPRGWLELHHAGDPGDLIVFGLVAQPHARGTLPFASVGEAADWSEYESMLLPISARQAHLTLFNPGPGPRAVTVEAVSAGTGSVARSTSLNLGPHRVESFLLARLFPGLPASTEPIRLRLRSDEAPLLVQGFTRSTDRSAAEIAFFPRVSAHSNGTYPLPDVERYDTTTTIVNVGEEDSTIAAQIYWQGGTYALGPLEVAAGETRQIDLEALAENLPPDLLGRELDMERPSGVLKWSVIGGGQELIGRTEARPKGSEDRFGFNCWGCCWQIPEGEIVPLEVSFTPNQQAGFQASMTMSDCSGTMGPFPTTPESISSPLPFVWNGSTVTASSAADGDLSFGTEALRISPTCASIWKWIFGFGRAKMCQKTFNPDGYDATKTCSSQTTTCTQCQTCCGDLFSQNVCRGKNKDTAQAERNACIGVCLSDRC